MASGLFKKTMVYLGLVDDEYDEADGYEPWAPQTDEAGDAGRHRGARRAAARAAERDDPDRSLVTSSVRTRG